MKVDYKVLGGSIQSAELHDGATVGDLKESIGCPTHTASVGGHAANDSTPLKANDYVNLSPSVKGGC